MFSEGREDVNDEERAGRPSTSTTDEKFNEVEKMILANCRIIVREVAEDLNISIGSCHSIFINDLGMRRVAAKFVPKLLNCDQKQHRMNIANEMLDSVRDDPNLLQRVITGDEAHQLSAWKSGVIYCLGFWAKGGLSIDPEFSAWLLKLGNGELTNDLGLDSDTFEIPSEMVCNGDLVKEIYGDKLLPSDFEQYTDKAILCPRKVDVDDINNRVLDILEGDSITYFSSDSIDDATPEDNESYPPVFLNSLNPSGMPLHKLKL
ncbi:hypothetical protein LAZ67_6001920 [Cordylochernes scorpioides]|uniref:ATP-dependent DNA helicase n=1 Tax=Cordylochernes scorpioides TaxID=51811 RepID=A0ABY6KJG2_9ARAC|nr:hypothetical protein LAZ67_6001920 [Cordylochernes scorpioides]